MPRFAEDKLTTGSLATKDTVQREQTRVVASPVDTYIHPAENDLLRLSQALEGFNGTFFQAAQTVQKKQDEVDTAEGAKKRQMEGTESTGVPPPESSRAFQAGYLSLHGQLSGLTVKQKVLQDYEENKNKPGYDPAASAQRIIADNMQGMTSKESIAGFMGNTAPLVNHVQSLYAKDQLEITRQTSRNDLFALATAKGAEIGLKPEAYRAWFDTEFAPTARGQNVSFADAANLATESLIQHAIETKDPKWLDAAHAKGADGRYLAENPEIAQKITAARKTVEGLQKQQLTEVANEVNKATAEQWVTLQTDPKASYDDVLAFVHKNSVGPYSLFGTDEKVQAAVRIAATRRESQVQYEIFNQAKRDGLLSAMKGQPGYEKYIAQDREQYWSAIRGTPVGSPENDKAINGLLNHITLTGEVDPGLSHMMSAAVFNMPLKGDKLEGDKLPNDLALTLRLYNGLKDSGNYPMVKKLMGDDAAHVLELVEQNRKSGMTDVQALTTAKQTTSPDTVARLKMIDGVESKAMKEQATSLLSGLFDSGSMFAAKNIDDASSKVQQMAMNIYGRGGVSPQAATEKALERYKQTHSLISGMWVEMPEGPRQDFVSKALAVELDKFSKDNNVNPGSLNITLQPGGKEYLLYDGANTGIFKRIPVTPLAEQGKEKAFLSDSQIIEAGNFRTLLEKKQLTGEQVSANWSQVSSFFAAGHINARQYEHMSSLRKSYLMEQDRGAAQKLNDMRNRFSRMVDVGDPNKDTLIPDLSREVPQPGGKNKDTYHYVQQYLEKDPTAALTMMNEGLRVSRYKDPNGKDWNIGFGYNMSSRTPLDVKRDLGHAGVAPEDISEVMAGRKEITPQAAVSLYQITRKQYEDNAKKALGEPVWQQMPANLKAVFTDLAYASGDAGKFKQAVAAVQKGDFGWLGDNLMISYQKDGVMTPDWRRIGLLRAMAKGTDTFGAYVSTAQTSYKKTGGG